MPEPIFLEVKLKKIPKLSVPVFLKVKSKKH
jgi:hypothetical protein